MQAKEGRELPRQQRIRNEHNIDIFLRNYYGNRKVFMPIENVIDGLFAYICEIY